MSTDDAPMLDLASAAEQLGVHYQTAYRWVRTGKLPAMMRGGRYVVDPEALARLDAARTTPVPVEPPGPARLAGAAERMERALRDGDEPAARSIAVGLAEQGASATDLIQHVFVPPLRGIGQAWHDGELSIWVEHRASAITERVLADLVPNPRGRRRGTAAVAAVAGDLHSLPTTMATAALREDRWRVHHLGADVPPDEIVAFTVEQPVDLVVLTVTNPDVTEEADDLAARLVHAGTRTIVGSPGRTLDDLRHAARHP